MKAYFFICFFAISLYETAYAQCDPGWLSTTESCYKIIQNKKQWPDAKKDCESMGAHLVIVMTDEENNFLQTELRKLHTDSGNQFWMDGTDLTTEGSWVWESTGDGFEVTDWYPGEPNQNGGEEDCLSFFANFNFHWNDEHCNRLESYICEMDLPIDNVIG